MINIHANCNFDGGDCCTDVLSGNRFCNSVNNFETCQIYDGEDCPPLNTIEWPECPHNPKFIGDGICDDHLKNKAECNHDGGDCCDNTLIGNGNCDDANKFQTCGNFDGGDCLSDGYCDTSLISNGNCDLINIHANCNFDGSDCCNNALIGNKFCNDINNFETCQVYDGDDCRPPNITDWPECPHNPKFIGDGICDAHLNSKECNIDGSDCISK